MPELDRIAEANATAEANRPEMTEWRESHKALLHEWKRQAAVCMWLQLASHYHYARINNWLTYPTVVITAFTSIGVWGIESSTAGKFVMSTVSLFAGILATISKHCRAAEKSNEFQLRSKEYLGIIREIDYILALDEDQRPEVGETMLRIRSTFDRIMDLQLDPPLNVIRLFEDRFKSLESSMWGSALVKELESSQPSSSSHGTGGQGAPLKQPGNGSIGCDLPPATTRGIIQSPFILGIPSSPEKEKERTSPVHRMGSIISKMTKRANIGNTDAMSSYQLMTSRALRGPAALRTNQWRPSVGIDTPTTAGGGRRERHSMDDGGFLRSQPTLSQNIDTIHGALHLSPPTEKRVTIQLPQSVQSVPNSDNGLDLELGMPPPTGTTRTPHTPAPKQPEQDEERPPIN